MKKWLLIPLTVFTLVACSGGDNPDLIPKKIPEHQKVGQRPVYILSGEDTLQFNEGVLSGSGVVRFSDTFKKAETAQNILLRFELADGGSLTLISNGTDNLGSAVSIVFTRPSGSAVLSVILKTDQESKDISALFAGINSSQPMKIAVDLHNNHGPNAEAIFWNDAPPAVELGEADINGRGLGIYWGLFLQESRVTHLNLAGPRETH